MLTAWLPSGLSGMGSPGVARKAASVLRSRGSGEMGAATGDAGEEEAAARITSLMTRPRNRSSVMKKAPEVVDTLLEVASDEARSWATRKEATRALLLLADGEDTVRALFTWRGALGVLLQVAGTPFQEDDPDAQDARKAAWEALDRFTVLPAVAAAMAQRPEVLDACATEILAKPPVAPFSALNVTRALCECSVEGRLNAVRNIRLVRALQGVVDVPLDATMGALGSDPVAQLSEQLSGETANVRSPRPKSMSLSIHDDEPQEVTPEEAIAVAHLRTVAFGALTFIAQSEVGRPVLLNAAPNIAKVAMQCLRVYDGSQYTAQIKHFLFALDISATTPSPHNFRFAPTSEAGKQLMFAGV